MKKITVLLVIVSSCFFSLLAQGGADEVSVRENWKFSGATMLSSATSSSLTGGYFSLNPGVRAQATATYGGFYLSAARNSDLLNSSSSFANINSFGVGYNRRFGNLAMTLHTEKYFFDMRKAGNGMPLDMVAPSLNILYRGSVNLEAFFVYGYFYEWNKDDIFEKYLFAQRVSVSKDFADFTFKVTGWHTYWNTDRLSLAGEVTKKLNDRFRITVTLNMNHDLKNKTNQGKKIDDPVSVTQKFGVVRLSYFF